jgi:hypothetical protein
MVSPVAAHPGGSVPDPAGRFRPGQLILHRQFVRDKLVFVRQARVVADDEVGLRLWLPHGHPAAIDVAVDGRGLRDMPFAEWIHQETVLTRRRWWGPDIFMYLPPASAHSVWWFWDAWHEFLGWYVNLEEEPVRWADRDLAGVDGTDQDLDVWVWPDRSWEWKDEDELAERLEFPDHYWVADPAAVRAEGERLIRLAEAGAFPFDGTWQNFRPDPAWAPPGELPEGWDRPRAPLSR